MRAVRARDGAGAMTGPRYCHIDDRSGRCVIMLPGLPYIHLSGAMVREIVRAYDRSRYRRRVIP